jgi:membrane protein
VGLQAWIDRTRSFVRDELWSTEPQKRAQLQVVRLLQFGIMVVEGFVRDHLMLRASALAYFTVISVVPLLAVAVSIANAVGVGSHDFVGWVVGTLAAGSPDAQQQIQGLVEGVSFRGLGTVSAGVLFVTTVLAIRNVESALNGIWGVTKGRSWSRRFSDYLAVLIVAPLLGGFALSLRTTLESEWLLQRLIQVPGVAPLFQLGLTQLPLLLLVGVYTFLYAFLPNTRVRLLSALLGAVPAALLTVAAQGIFLGLGVGATRASMFFGSFAALPLLFAWIYALWAIVLLGAELAFAHQNFELYRREVRGGPLGTAEREAIGLRIALEVGRRFRDGSPCAETADLADALRVPVRSARDVVQHLVAAGILSLRAETDEGEALQLGRPAERIAVIDVLHALRGAREPEVPDTAVAASAERVLAEIEEGTLKSAGGYTLAALLAEVPPVRDVDPAQTGG